MIKKEYDTTIHVDNKTAFVRAVKLCEVLIATRNKLQEFLSESIMEKDIEPLIDEAMAMADALVEDNSDSLGWYLFELRDKTLVDYMRNVTFPDGKVFPITDAESLYDMLVYVPKKKRNKA